jgi:hypothetical protein
MFFRNTFGKITGLFSNYVYPIKFWFALEFFPTLHYKSNVIMRIFNAQICKKY